MPDSLLRDRVSNWWARLIEQRFGAVILFFTAFVSISWIVRLSLLVKAAVNVSWNSSLLAVAVWGTLFDVAEAALWAVPVILALIVLPRRFFHWRWARALTYLAAFATASLIVFSCVGEWFFWDEFGMRFNFIAVDYLVYTSEVTDNIRESYPMPPVFAGIFTGAGLIIFALWRNDRRWSSAR